MPPAEVTPPARLTIAELVRDRRMYGILLDHAFLGIRVQFMLRAALVTFLIATIAVVPPLHNVAACSIVIGLYAIWSAAAFVLCQRGGVRIRLIWCTLAIDVIVLGLLSLLASSSHQTWTTDVLVNGFFLVPMLATTELRPSVGAAVTAPALAIYIAVTIAAQADNTEPTSAIVLGAVVLGALSAGSVALSWVQRSRVLTIAGLSHDRRALTDELVDVERSAREGLAEELHDGALQYVLAARQDLDDIRAVADPVAVQRIETALTESAALLRAKVSQLHPAVITSVGLRRALADLCRSAARPGLEVTFDGGDWPERPRGATDDLLYSAARELLTNAARHAHARHVSVTLASECGTATLVVADDGTGIDDAALSTRLREGHVGLASQRTRIEVAGGTLTITSADPGTVVTVMLADPSP